MPEPPPAYADSVKSNVNSPDMLGQNMAYPGQNYNPSQNYATQPVYPSGGSYAPTGAVYASNPSPQPVSQPTMAPSGGSGNADPGTGSSLSPALTAGLGAGAGALAGSLLGSGIGSYFANRNSGSGGSGNGCSGGSADHGSSSHGHTAASRTYGGGYVSLVLKSYRTLLYREQQF